MDQTIEDATRSARHIGEMVFGGDAGAEQMFDAASIIVTLLAPFFETADVSDDEMNDIDAELRKRPGKYDPSFRVDL